MELCSQHIVMPGDLNFHGNLFGGRLLAWMDEGAAMFVMNRIAYTNIVTVAMDDVHFRTPGKTGDIIQIYANVEKTGRSSIKLRSTAIDRNPNDGSYSEIIDCRITFVCLDDSGKPYPYFEKYK